MSAKSIWAECSVMFGFNLLNHIQTTNETSSRFKLLPELPWIILLLKVCYTNTIILIRLMKLGTKQENVPKETLNLNSKDLQNKKLWASLWLWRLYLLKVVPMQVLALPWEPPLTLGWNRKAIWENRPPPWHLIKPPMFWSSSHFFRFVDHENIPSAAGFSII